MSAGRAGWPKRVPRVEQDVWLEARIHDRSRAGLRVRANELNLVRGGGEGSKHHRDFQFISPPPRGGGGGRIESGSNLIQLVHLDELNELTERVEYGVRSGLLLVTGSWSPGRVLPGYAQ
jgi:hypothetical protein